jgi:excisionase family DNA binding protein|tara:strand:- start:232 stop:462 length:231 start_codon:yes stop_codon:yes gene_type:complete
MKATLQVKEVSKILSLGINQTYKACERGEIPSIRMGHRWVIPSKAFFQWLETCGGKVRPEGNNHEKKTKRFKLVQK